MEITSCSSDNPFLRLSESGMISLEVSADNITQFRIDYFFVLVIE